VAVAAGDDKKRASAGVSSTTVGVAAVFERLKEDVRRSIAARPSRPPQVPIDPSPTPVPVRIDRAQRARARLSHLRTRLVFRLRDVDARSPRRRSVTGRFDVAYYSPLPPEHSGVADYSAVLLPELCARMAVGVGRRRGRPPEADVALYHVGNNPDAHDWIVEALFRRTGIVVLHEVVLHHLVVGMTIGRGDPEGYLRALERDAGARGRELGARVLEGSIPPLWETEPERFPLVNDVLDAASAVVVHSRYAEERVRATGFSGPIHRIAHPARRPGRVEPARLTGGPVIGFFGHMTPAKRVPVLLNAFAALRRSYPDARLLVVGSKAPQLDLDAELSRAGLHGSPAVLREDWVPEERLTSLMAACDVCVNLRGPTMGETSGSAVRSLALGRPLVVSDIGWFAELPDEVALKVPPDEFELPTLTAALGLLVGDDGLRRTLGGNGAAYALREHDLERVADDYAALLGAERQVIPDDVVSGSTRGLSAAP